MLGGFPAVCGILLAQVLGSEFVVPIGVHLHTNTLTVVAGCGVQYRGYGTGRYWFEAAESKTFKECLRPDPRFQFVFPSRYWYA